MNALLLTVLLAAAPSLAAERGNLVIEGIPEIPAEVAERMLQYQNTRGVALLEPAEDGRGLLIGTRFAETNQLHWVDKPLGMRRQLTFFKEPVKGAWLRPGKPDELALMMDVGGSENLQLYVFDRKTGRSRMITDGKSRNESARWSRSGDRLAYVGTERNGKDFDLWLYEAATGARSLALELEGQWHVLDWAPGDGRLLLQRYVSINESYIHAFDLGTKKLELLFDKKASYPAAAWGPAGKSVYFTSDRDGEFVALYRKDLASGKTEALAKDLRWDVEDLEVSRDGTRVAFTANEDGASALYLLDGARLRKVRGLPLGVIGRLSFSAAGARLAYVLNSAVSPGDAYVLDWALARPERWTQSETGGLPPETFAAPALIRYKTFDGREIPSFYYRPKAEGPRPFVVLIHGGPESQSQPYFSPTVQYWVNELGLAVLVPNVRGSSGYGKSYLMLDNGFKREDSVKDVGALLDWAAKQPELDRSRAAVYGGSYGGYMVLASMARYADRLRAGVDIVGISNFVTFLNNTKDYRRDLRRAEYGDERDPQMKAFLEKISPTAIVSEIKDPLFVVQGANDPRVPASEAEQIVKAVRAGGKPTWYLLAKDEGHGFAKKANRDYMDQAVVLFWQEHLLK